MNSEASIWDDADFEPFFISFSGGGASYTSTVTKQSIKEQTRTRTLSSNSGGSLGIEASLNDIGFETSFGDMSTLTETRSQSQNSATSLTYSYTPFGRGRNQHVPGSRHSRTWIEWAHFPNLGAITSCPYVAEDEAEFHEWYPALIPGLSNINPTMLDCESGTVQTPTWANTIDPNALVLEQSTGQVWTHMNPAPNFSYDGLGSDAVALQATVAMSAAMAATAGLAASGGNVGGAVLAGVVVGAGLGMFALDLVKTTIWRNAVAAEYGTTLNPLATILRAWSPLSRPRIRLKFSSPQGCARTFLTRKRHGWYNPPLYRPKSLNCPFHTPTPSRAKSSQKPSP